MGGEGGRGREMGFIKFVFEGIGGPGSVVRFWVFGFVLFSEIPSGC